MTAQAYIQSKLEDLRRPAGLAKPADDERLAQAVFKAVMSKKFRKLSVTPSVLEHIQASINYNVKHRQPIKFTLPFGAYKLWRLDETPEADWAELFAMMYFTKWLKPVCELYEPGAWFDFFSDDVIIPRMNNVPADGLRAYNRSFHELLDFIKPYQPDNLSMTITRVIDRYDSQDDFEKELEQQIAGQKSGLDGGLPVLDPADKATIELNVKATPEQLGDPRWREKVLLLHNAYSAVSRRRPYYRPPEKHKIMVVTTPLQGGLAVGSTKDSTMKFWIGAGVLRPRGDNYRSLVYSPSQLKEADFRTENLAIKGLSGKNFGSIRVLQ